MTNASIAFVEALKEDLSDLSSSNEDFDIAVFVHCGFDDVLNENILSNYNLLFSIMFLFLLVMLGKINCVEQHVWLIVAGMKISFFIQNWIVNVSGLSGIVIGSVFCLGLMFTQLHNVLPFLMLGIGINDLFVLV